MLTKWHDILYGSNTSTINDLLILNVNIELVIWYFNCLCVISTLDAMSVCKHLVVKLVVSLALF